MFLDNIQFPPPNGYSTNYFLNKCNLYNISRMPIEFVEDVR